MYKILLKRAEGESWGGLGNFSAVKKAIYIFCDFEICYAYNNDYPTISIYIIKYLNKIFIYVYFVLDLL